jgi:hypothetical protein
LCQQTLRKVVPDPQKLASQISGLTGELGKVAEWQQMATVIVSNRQ